MDALRLPAVSRCSGSVRPPGSKSLANRALPLAALARGETRLRNLPDGEDVALMREALGKLGVPFRSEANSLVISGAGGPLRIRGSGDLFLGNSGTATRFLTALLAAGEGVFRLDGVPRMRERPLGDLVDALRQLAGDTRFVYEGQEGFPPLRIEARGLAGGKARVRGDASSQFVTGLLLALPLCHGDAEVEIEGRLVSAPYVDLTLKAMESFGVSLERDGFRRFGIRKPAAYVSPGMFSVEPDASSASYFLAAGAISGGPVTVTGLGRDSAQGEIKFAEILRRMGARVEYVQEGITVSNLAGKPGPLQGLDADMDSMSDTGMTLAVTALFANGPTTIRNIGNWRLKETDRIRAMAVELRKLGATVEEGPDFLVIHPPAALNPEAAIDTYDDHRMAMCFSLVCLGGVPVTIRDPGCVRKTYPDYFEDFKKLAGL
jgi:3-phosphoshikimate 1-carboxyvinyltransferase